MAGWLVLITGSGIGLRKRAAWGFYWHLAAALLAAVSCFGVFYTIIAMAFALRPSFRAALLGKPTPRDLDTWDVST